MARRKKMTPLHPGAVLYKDFIVSTGISIHRRAMDLRVPANRIAEIVKGQSAISADTALRLARYLGTSPEFWLGLQSDYELEKAKGQVAEKTAREARPRNRPAYPPRREAFSASRCRRPALRRPSRYRRCDKGSHL